MVETVENSEKTRCIEKHIISFLFKKNGFQENEYTDKVHYKISDQLRKDWGSFISNDEIDIVLSNLIESKFIFRNNENFLRITTDGLNYALANTYIGIGNVINYCDTLHSKQLDYTISQFKSLGDLKERLEQQKKELDEKTTELDSKISSFYNNIISIMALLLAAFSIIGFNISGIKFIVANTETLPGWTYVGSIMIINISIIVSLFCVFRLVQNIVYPGYIKAQNTDYNLKVRIFNNKTFQLIIIICNILLILYISIDFLYPIIQNTFHALK